MTSLASVIMLASSVVTAAGLLCHSTRDEASYGGPHAVCRAEHCLSATSAVRASIHLHSFRPFQSSRLGLNKRSRRRVFVVIHTCKNVTNICNSLLNLIEQICQSAILKDVTLKSAPAPILPLHLAQLRDPPSSSCAVWRYDMLLARDSPPTSESSGSAPTSAGGRGSLNSTLSVGTVARAP